jgi:ABC-type nitrate/sulfonate/bicarbonate transport system substrate-binding protein
MVVSGQAQASLYNLESIMQATVHDGSLVIVAVNRVVFALMSRPEMASVKDVKGKTVAVSQIGDPPYQFASAYLKKFGLGPRDVQWVAVGSDANSRAAALRAGRAHATLLTPPAYFRLEEAGYRNLGNLADYDDLFGSAVYVFSRHTISANPTLPELLIKAHAEATKRFYDDKPFAVRAYRVYDNQTQADVERLYEIYVKGNLLERVRFVPVDALQGVMEQIDAQVAAQMKSFDFRRVVNNSIISRLLGEGHFEGLFGPSIKSEQDRKAGLAYK